MSEKIEPVAWAMTDYQADGPNTQFTRVRDQAEFYVAHGLDVEPLYSATTVSALEARIRELEANDRRYRYLRDDAFRRPDMTPAVIVADAEFDVDSEHTEGFMFGEELDAAIDALTGASLP